MYFIEFLGAYLEQTWISDNDLIKYEGIESFKTYAQNQVDEAPTKSAKEKLAERFQLKVSMNKRALWEEAIKQADLFSRSSNSLSLLSSNKNCTITNSNHINNKRKIESSNDPNCYEPKEKRVIQNYSASNNNNEFNTHNTNINNKMSDIKLQNLSNLKKNQNEMHGNAFINQNFIHTHNNDNNGNTVLIKKELFIKNEPENHIEVEEDEYEVEDNDEEEEEDDDEEEDDSLQPTSIYEYDQPNVNDFIDTTDKNVQIFNSINTNDRNLFNQRQLDYLNNSNMINSNQNIDILKYNMEHKDNNRDTDEEEVDDDLDDQEWTNANIPTNNSTNKKYQRKDSTFSNNNENNRLAKLATETPNTIAPSGKKRGRKPKLSQSDQSTHNNDSTSVINIQTQIQQIQQQLDENRKLANNKKAIKINSKKSSSKKSSKSKSESSSPSNSSNLTSSSSTNSSTPSSPASSISESESDDLNYLDVEKINRKKQHTKKRSSKSKTSNKKSNKNDIDFDLNSTHLTSSKLSQINDSQINEMILSNASNGVNVTNNGNGTAETYLIDRYKYAVRHIQQGLSVEEACNKYRISKGALLKCLSGGTAPRGKKTRLTELEENEIVEWLINDKDLKYNDAIHLVFERVVHIFQQAKRPNPFNNGRPSMDWWYDFLSRHPQIMASKPDWLMRGKVNQQYIKDVQSGQLKCTKFRRALLSAIQYINSLNETDNNKQIKQFSSLLSVNTNSKASVSNTNTKLAASSKLASGSTSGSRANNNTNNQSVSKKIISSNKKLPPKSIKLLPQQSNNIITPNTNFSSDNNNNNINNNLKLEINDDEDDDDLSSIRPASFINNRSINEDEFDADFLNASLDVDENHLNQLIDNHNREENEEKNLSLDLDENKLSTTIHDIIMNQQRKQNKLLKSNNGNMNTNSNNLNHLLVTDDDQEDGQQNINHNSNNNNNNYHKRENDINKSNNSYRHHSLVGHDMNNDHDEQISNTIDPSAFLP